MMRYYLSVPVATTAIVSDLEWDCRDSVFKAGYHDSCLRGISRPVLLPRAVIARSVLIAEGMVV